MTKHYLYFLIFLSWGIGAQVKIGNNPTTINAGALLELESTDKALLMPRVASPDAITAPVNGMMIYDTTLHCLRGYQSGAWSGCNFVVTNATSGGSSVISKIECNVASPGSLMLQTEAVATQTIKVTATTAGNYAINATANGVTFSASGTLNIGITVIELKASGMPLSGGIHTFAFDVAPAVSCTFTREVLGEPSTNGTAIVSAYTPVATEHKVLSGTSVVPGIKQRIMATVTQIGSYNIKAEMQGLVFAATGNFDSLGQHPVDLVATGTPSGSGEGDMTTNTTPSCSFQVGRYTTANWMGAFPDTTSLSQLTIPGTHDSGARYDFAGIAGTAKCQDLTISQQLEAGVRFLDIRVCDLSTTGGELRIMHGIVDQLLFFHQVFETIKAFLSANPTETVVLSLKGESSFFCTISDQVVYDKLKTNHIDTNPNLWILSNTISNLGDARGKIILFSRFFYAPQSSFIGIQAPFQNNTTFSIESPAQLQVQDYYDIGNSNNFYLKWDKFYSLLMEAKNDTTNRLYVNFASGYISPNNVPEILPVKSYMNSMIDDFLTQNTTQGKYGAILLDYISSDLSRKMIKTNFYQFGSN